MISSLILIAGDKLMADVYQQKLLHQNSIELEFAQSEDEILEKVDLLEPDLVLLSTQIEDGDGFTLCKKIRNISYISRPVIVMISDKTEEESQQRIQGLMAGADDYINSSISDEELSARIFAHLRRHIEEVSDQITKLPGSNLVNSLLKRKINLNVPWSLMLVSLENFKSYDDSYGNLAGTQLLRAFIAIVNSLMEKSDLFGQMSHLDFAIITKPHKAELMAEKICKTIDQVIPKFYSLHEAQRGYTIITDDEHTSLKIPLVSTSIGMVSNTYRYFDNYKTALSIAADMKELAKYQVGSGWLLDRPLLSGEEAVVIKNSRPYILVIEPDAALAYLLTTTLEIEGYAVDATSNKEDAISLIDEYNPDVVLIDAVIQGNDGWEICHYIRSKKELKNTKIIMATVLHDKEKAFSLGADIYIPKPYELLSLHKWIHRFIHDRTYSKIYY